MRVWQGQRDFPIPESVGNEALMTDRVGINHSLTIAYERYNLIDTWQSTCMQSDWAQVNPSKSKHWPK